METAVEELRERLRNEGVVRLRSLFRREPLTRLREASSRCFETIEAGGPIPEQHRYIPQAHSVLLTALLDFGIGSEQDLLAPLSGDMLGAMFTQLIGGPWRCRLEHCWVRKKFAPGNGPKDGYALQDWHQDGALGVRFPPEPGPAIPATNLVTCWIPFDACGRESPGLEFICEPPPCLLHFTELHDSALRRRFEVEAFWAPQLEFGDGLVFRNDVLHRTHVTGGMRTDRMSVEYRVFPGET